jgi:hypothetical protein
VGFLGTFVGYRTFRTAVNCMKVLRSSFRVSDLTKFGVWRQISVIVPDILNDTKIRRMGASLVHAEGQT